MLLKVIIVDFKTGLCLFEKTWKWSGVSRHEGIAKLVRTFYQISKDIGDSGEVSQVIFNQPSVYFSGVNANPTPRDRGITGNTTVTRFVGSIKNQKQSKEQPPTIRLASSKNDHIIVAAFHESTDDLSVVKKFSYDVLQEFDQQYAKKLKELRQTLDEIDESEEQASPQAMELMKIFAAYEDPLETVKNKYQAVITQSTKQVSHKNNNNDNNNDDDEDE
jgi:hypothetical protein